jgi:hypothetical protein
MAKRRRKPPVRRCRACHLGRESWEHWPSGFCPTCCDRQRLWRSRRTGARILARATAKGLEERDGEMYRVVVLPPKRKRGR